MKKLAFSILGFCLIPFYLLGNLKLFPSHPQSFEIGTLLLSTTTACNWKEGDICSILQPSFQLFIPCHRQRRIEHARTFSQSPWNTCSIFHPSFQLFIPCHRQRRIEEENRTNQCRPLQHTPPPAFPRTKSMTSLTHNRSH